MSGLDDARNALAEGRWADADAEIADEPPTADGLEVRAEARWWLGRVDDAIAAWGEAYELSREAGDDERAARLAAWVSREYAAVGNDSAAGGWRTRAAPEAGSAASGWAALASATLASDPAQQEDLAAAALADARAAGDRDRR